MEATKISKSFDKESENQVWCCAWGLLQPDSKDTNSEDEEGQEGQEDQEGQEGQEGQEVQEGQEGEEGEEGDEGEEGEDSDNLKPKEFVVTGGYQSEIRIVYISSTEEDAFPHEYNHELRGLGAHNVAISPDSNCIATVGIDGNLSLLDIKDGVRLPRVAHSHTSNFWSAAFSSKNDCIYAGTGTGMIYIYDTMMGKLQHGYNTQRYSNVVGLAVSGDQTLVGSTDLAGNFTLIDGNTGQIVRSRNFSKPLRRLAYDPNMQYALAACDDKTVKIIDLPNGKMRETLLAHDSYVMSVAVSPDGSRFVSGGADGTVKVWDVRTTKCSLSFICDNNSNLWDVAFSRQSNKISFVGDGKGLCIYYCLGNREMMLV